LRIRRSVGGVDGRERKEECFVETILILDDDPENLQVIGDVLRSEHYFVLEASTGLQAIERAKHCGRLSLFVTEINRSDVAMKLFTLYPNLPVLFLSGTPMVSWTSLDVSNFNRFPPPSIDLIEKPFSVSQLLMRVRSLIGRNRTIRSEWACLSQFL
jgi:CheY-like chemotaxis protein